MNKKTKGLMAGAAGAALLLGGGTFALWSDGETVDGGTVTAGNLAVTQFGETQWHDISNDREDQNHEIDDLDAFRIIPGDTIRGQFFLDAALEGENMVAQLGVESDFVEDNEFLDVTMRLHGPDGVIESRDWDGEPIEVLFASEDNGNPEGLPTLPVDVDGNVEFHVLFHITFDEGTEDQDHVQESVDLGEVQVSLDQVRSEAPGYRN